MNTRTLRSSWLWGGLLILLGGYLLLRNFNLAPDLGSFWGLVAAAGAVVFFLMWLENRQQWWWLIPALNLAGVAIVSGLAAVGVSGELAGSIFLWMIALSFWLVWLVRRDQWWAIIPAGVMTIVGAMPLLSQAAPGELVGSFFLLGIGIAFLVVYLARNEHWWALIPAGVMITLSLMPIIGETLPGQATGAIFFVGLGGTFLILYLLRAKHPTGWAIWPGGILVLVGVVTGLSTQLGKWWPLIALIGPGVWLLWRGMRGRKAQG